MIRQNRIAIPLATVAKIIANASYLIFMQFALVDNNRAAAKPQLQGLCSCCMQPVVAKCGNQKIWHWAHKSKTACDNWWEPETAWHRSWKNHYPTDCQEISLPDEKTGEKHIADVRTVHGLVVEFQHSPITVQERTAREHFYKNMVWVVDGTRLKRDYPRFLKGRKNSFENQIFYNTEHPKIFRVDLIDWCLPSAWLKSSVPVVFDFKGDGTLDDSEGFRESLYCLFPQTGNYARVAEISRQAFINATNSDAWTLRVDAYTKEIREEEKSERKEQAAGFSGSSNTVQYAWRGIPLIGGSKEYRKRLSASLKLNRKGRR